MSLTGYLLWRLGRATGSAVCAVLWHDTYAVAPGVILCRRCGRYVGHDLGALVPPEPKPIVRIEAQCWSADGIYQTRVTAWGLNVADAVADARRQALSTFPSDGGEPVIEIISDEWVTK